MNMNELQSNRCTVDRKRNKYSENDGSTHYENTPIQIYRKFHLQKLKIFRLKNSDIFHISAQNVDCGYSLEPPRRNKKKMYTPVNPIFTI